MSLQNFLTTVNTYGIAKTNRFLVEFPAWLPEADRIVQTYATSVVIPGFENAADALKVQGPQYYVPTGLNQEPILRIDLYVDTTHLVKRHLEKWMFAVQDRASGHISYFNEYAKDIDVTIFDSVVENKDAFTKETGFKEQLKNKFLQKPPTAAKTKEYEVAKYKFTECWPKSISSLTFDNASSDYMKLTLELYYTRMYPVYAGSFEQYTLTYPQNKVPTGILGKAMNAGTQFLQQKGLDLADTAGGVVNSLKNFKI